MFSNDTNITLAIEITIDRQARHDLLKGIGVHKGCKRLIREREGRCVCSKNESAIYGTLFTYWWFDDELSNEPRLNDIVEFALGQMIHRVIDRRPGHEIFSESM